MGLRTSEDFASKNSSTGRDLLWCTVFGGLIGLIAMAFTISLRRARVFMFRWAIPHWIKMTLEAFSVVFADLYFWYCIVDRCFLWGQYEAVGEILKRHHGSLELVVFGLLKLAATCSRFPAAVSAPCLSPSSCGGRLGTAFAQPIPHSGSIELYAAVGMVHRGGI
ncbi:MAG: chloride channel protein [Acidobacteriota bacterium]